MRETIPRERAATAAEPAGTAGLVLCPLCWQRLGRPCTITGPDGDHLARWLEAEQRGVITRDQLATVVGTLEVIAPHVIVRAGVP